MKYNVHGNGFVQLQLNGNRRLHIFSDSVPRQRVPTLIHNHRFRFMSSVVRGTMVNIRMMPMVDGYGDWHAYHPGTDAVPNIDGKLVRHDDYRYRIGEMATDVVAQGGVYGMREGSFHMSVPIGDTVTVMEIVEKCDHITPLVFCHKHLEPDNEFSRVDAMTSMQVRMLVGRLDLQSIIDFYGGLAT